MKNNFKFFIVLTILLTACLCVGSAFAADMSVTNDVVSNMDDTRTIEIAHDDSSQDVESNTLKENSVGNFSELQRDISGKHNVTLNKSYAYNVGDVVSGVVISSNNVVIEGNGFTIDGSNLARAFYIYGDNVTIKNINFINTRSNSSYGGAIYLLGATNFSIIGCNFTNSTVNGSGGAIYLSNSNRGSVINCSFTNCTASSLAGAILWSSYNGAVIGCSFINCGAGSAGGAIEFTASNNGSVSNCSFSNCTSSYGGAVSWASINGSLSNCSFSDCVASQKGSAIYIRSYDSLSIADCTCTSVDGDEKAPIYNEGTILSDVEITTLDGEDKSVNYGDDIKLTATMTTSDIPVAGGNMVLKVNGHELNATSDVNGLYSALYTVDFTGTKAVDATYPNSTGGQTVNPGNLTIKVTPNVTIYVDNITYGEDAIINVVVTGVDGGAVPTGNVTLYLGTNQITVPLEDGYASYTFSGLGAGDYVGNVHYNGDSKYNFILGEFDFTVAKADPTIIVEIGPNKPVMADIVDGDDVIVIVTLPTDATGQVRFSIDGGKTWVYADVIDGIEKYTFKGLKAGKYTLIAEYLGDDNYNAIKAQNNFVVKNASNPKPNLINNTIGNMENTGNPLLVLLIALCTIGLGSLRRKF